MVISTSTVSAVVNNGGEKNKCCSSPGCTNIVQTLLACPKCLQLGLPPTYFCGQECYTKNYATHKMVHKKGSGTTPQETTSSTSSSTTTTITNTALDQLVG
jgi:zf-MYND-like zinc finger, mRNA-binding